MNNNLKVFHTKAKSSLDPKFVGSHGLIHWKTCIREIVISFDTDLKLSGFEDEYTGAEAYKFLLEVISGMHSQILGETEILGQFKILCEKHRNINPKLWGSLLKDAKFIRSRYLKDYGVQSYGGAARVAASNATNVHMIGSGHLAESILYHFAGFKKSFNLYCRDKNKGMMLDSKLEKVHFEIRELESFANKVQHNDLVLVAAPVTSSWLEKSFTEVNALEVLDFRSTRDHEQYIAPKNMKYTNLDEIFQTIQNGQSEMKKRVFKIKDEIINKSLEWDNKKVFRPFGWEDICVL